MAGQVGNQSITLLIEVNSTLSILSAKASHFTVVTIFAAVVDVTNPVVDREHNYIIKVPLSLFVHATSA